ncbi:MAG TPA: hypothetical protein VMT87_13440 [Vicinamibacteria bacterium]|nr:hypothetical protein [Vicinamibacteria bacterium]
MDTHLEDLRAEVPKHDDGARLLRAATDDAAWDALAPSDRAILAFAVKLTRTPSRMTGEDVSTLRAHGLTDEAIHDVVQITALFNYYNRLADGLGVDPE